MTKINYEELCFLRGCTNLNPYQYLKLKKLRLEEQKKLNLNQKTNFEKIDIIEYAFRIKTYQITNFELWRKHGQKFGVDEFMERLLENDMKTKKIKRY